MLLLFMAAKLRLYFHKMKNLCINNAQNFRNYQVFCKRITPFGRHFAQIPLDIHT